MGLLFVERKRKSKGKYNNLCSKNNAVILVFLRVWLSKTIPSETKGRLMVTITPEIPSGHY